MKSRRTDQAPTEKTFNFGFGERQPHDYEAYRGNFAIINTPQQSYLGRVDSVNNDCVVMKVPDAIDTEHGPRYMVGKTRVTIAREAIMAIRGLSPVAYNLAVDDQYHGPLASLCGEFLDIQEGQNGWVGRLIYVNHPVHRAMLSPVIGPRRTELGMMNADLVKGPLEFTYNAPIVRLLTEEEVKGLIATQRQQDSIRHREAQLRDFDLTMRVEELYRLTNNGARTSQQELRQKKDAKKKKK